MVSFPLLLCLVPSLAYSRILGWEWGARPESCPCRTCLVPRCSTLVVFQLNVAQTCPKRVPNMSQMCWQWLVGPWDWQGGVLGGNCWPAPAPAPAAGNRASRGWGKVDVIVLTWDPPTQCPAPHGHEGDDCPLPVSPCSTSSPLLSLGLWLLTAASSPGKGLGWGL